MKNLKKLVEKTATQQTWCRKALQNFFETWADVTADVESVVIELPVEIDSYDPDDKFLLVTGRQDLCRWNYGIQDWNPNEGSWSALPIKTVKAILKSLPQSLKEAEEAMEKEEKEIIEIKGALKKALELD